MWIHGDISQVGSCMSQLFLSYLTLLLFYCYHMIAIFILNAPWTFLCALSLEPWLQGANAQILLAVTARIGIRAFLTIEECWNKAILWSYCIISSANRRHRCWLATCRPVACCHHYRSFHCAFSFLFYFFTHLHLYTRVLCRFLGARLLCRQESKCFENTFAHSVLRACMFRI